jgi:hypothetical protein
LLQQALERTSALGARVIPATAEITAATATPTGATRIKAVATALAAAVAAILPAAGSGAALTTAATGITAATAPIATAASAAAVTTTGTIAAAVTATAIATAATTTAAATTGTAGFGLVDTQGTTHQLNPLQGIDGLGLQLGIGQLHKGETALATGVPFQGEGTVRHLSMGGEKLDDVFLLGAEGQIADENAH